MSQGIGFQADAFRNTTFTPPINFAQLPASPVKGERAVVQDSNTAVFNAVIAGGGANVIPALYNGTNWVVG